jgi:hypothetical protein
MNGLRMFIRPDQQGRVENNVFYSQRSNGPMYRWDFEDHLGRWHVSRVGTSDLSSHELCTARWHSVPQELRAQLNEHYVE